MADQFQYHAPGLDSPGSRHFPIVASSSLIDPRPRSIVCLSAGSLTIEDELGVQITYALDAGAVLPFRATKVVAISAGTFAGWI